MIPNSWPFSGRKANILEAPINDSRDVRRNDPQAAHPTPKIPLVIPRNPVAIPFCFTSLIFLRKKKASIATFIPKRIAIRIVYEAESKVKFVAIAPRRFIGNVSFWIKGISDEVKTFTMRLRFGNHTARANIVMLTIEASSIYLPLLNTFFKAFIIMVICPEELDR